MTNQSVLGTSMRYSPYTICKFRSPWTYAIKAALAKSLADGSCCSVSCFNLSLTASHKSCGIRMLRIGVLLSLICFLYVLYVLTQCMGYVIIILDETVNEVSNFIRYHLKKALSVYGLVNYKAGRVFHFDSIKKDWCLRQETFQSFSEKGYAL